MIPVTQEPSDPDRIRAARLEKLERAESVGIRAYPTTFPRTHLSAEIIDQFESLEGQRVGIAGRVGVFRVFSKKLAFVFLTDGAGQVQLLLHPHTLSEQSRAVYEALDPGDFAGAIGTVVKTRTGEISVEADEVALLAKALRNPPEKWHGISDVEIRYRQRYLDLMSSADARQVFRNRSRVVSEVRRFLIDRDFLEVETPILQPIPGGGAARPFTTHSNALDGPLFMRIALELHLKRCIIGGFERVFEIGKNFRNEGMSFKHNPEFTMLELYEAYADYKDVMALTEQMISTVAIAVTGSTRVVWGDQEIDLTPPWRRISLRTALFDLSGVDYASYPDGATIRVAAERVGLRPDPTWNRGKVMDELLTAFVEPKLIQPTFLVDYPTAFPGSTLAKPKPGNPAEVERFELFCGAMEIGNAFSELNDPRIQRERFEEQQRARQAGDDEAQLFDADFLSALEQGMPPTGGLGIGIDRVTMLLTNQRTIRDVILFPQLRQQHPDRAATAATTTPGS